MTSLISIIIVNYNTCDLTCNCIQSIYRKISSFPFEIILVDNASCDDSIYKIKKLYPQVNIIVSPINLGFGKANNLGVKSAQGDFLFLLNSDTIIEDDPFPVFFGFMKKNNKISIGVLGCFLTDTNGLYSKSGGEFYSTTKYLKSALNSYFEIYNTKEINTDKDALLIDYVIGADMFISKQLFNKIGGFDEHIFMYFEDVELNKRIAKLGYKSYLLKGSRITHLVNSSSSSQFSRLYNTASLMYCLRKEMGFSPFFLFQITYFFLKMPILFTELYKFQENLEYILSIFKYKKYLVKN
jgi:GT2 family glycosyltransferase